MKNKTFIVLVLGMAAIATFLVFQATRESSSVVLRPTDLVGIEVGRELYRIRVGGKVADAPIEYATEPQMILKFTLTDANDLSAQVPVVYEGLKPDMFTAGRDVIIDGEYVGGELRASKLLTQCPSKYEPPKPSQK